MALTTTTGEAKAVAAGLLEAAGMPGGPARRTAWALVVAEVWGARSHGLLRLPHYLRRFAAGGTNPTASLRLVSDQKATAVYDGNNGLGHWQLWDAATDAVTRARDHGLSAVALANSGHCGALGLYALPMVEAGLAGVVLCNGPAAMPPWGGHAPVLSTSPIAAGLPTAPEPTIIDLATSAAARGTIAELAAAGKDLPPGWAFDADGRPTTDPEEALAGMLAPMGGAKGYALALLVEALTGAMVGPHLASDVADPLAPSQDGRPQRVAHLVLALDTRSFDPDGSAGERFALLAERIGTAGGRLPGASRLAASRAPDDTPLEVTPTTVEALAERATVLGVELPSGWGRPGAG
ncbi:MAG: Ldh family oxidoreductase [Acidimicrobiales bacterium]